MVHAGARAVTIHLAGGGSPDTKVTPCLVHLADHGSPKTKVAPCLVHLAPNTK